MNYTAASNFAMHLNFVEDLSNVSHVHSPQALGKLRPHLFEKLSSAASMENSALANTSGSVQLGKGLPSASNGNIRPGLGKERMFSREKQFGLASVNSPPVTTNSTGPLEFDKPSSSASLMSHVMPPEKSCLLPLDKQSSLTTLSDVATSNSAGQLPLDKAIPNVPVPMHGKLRLYPYDKQNTSGMGSSSPTDCSLKLALDRDTPRSAVSYPFQIQNGQIIYPCDICDKHYTSMNGLAYHKQVHAGLKPYMCDECPKTFTSKGNLTTHKRKHTGERPYTCPICEKSFTQSCSLIAHRRKHTGEKPYVCCFCEKSFSYLSGLQTHRLRQHTLEKCDCKKCTKLIYTQRDIIAEGNKHKKSKHDLLYLEDPDLSK